MSKPVLYARDLDGTGSMHVCAQDDPGAIEFVAIDDETREALELAIEALNECDSIDPNKTHYAVHILERLRGTSG